MTNRAPSIAAETEHPVVLFDGVCNLCNGSVNFVIDRDPRGLFRFASLQSDAAHELLRRVGRTAPVGDPESILLVEGGNVYEASGAILRIARRLTGIWVVFAVLLVVPRPIRDAVYRWVARHRYRWFGKSEVCRVPMPGDRARFLA